MVKECGAPFIYLFFYFNLFCFIFFSLVLISDTRVKKRLVPLFTPGESERGDQTRVSKTATAMTCARDGAPPSKEEEKTTTTTTTATTKERDQQRLTIKTGSNKKKRKRLLPPPPTHPNKQTIEKESKINKNHDRRRGMRHLGCVYAPSLSGTSSRGKKRKENRARGGGHPRENGFLHSSFPPLMIDLFLDLLVYLLLFLYIFYDGCTCLCIERRPVQSLPPLCVLGGVGWAFVFRREGKSIRTPSLTELPFFRFCFSLSLYIYIYKKGDKMKPYIVQLLQIPEAKTTTTTTKKHQQ
eukprot:gene8842-6223_t